MNQEISKLLYRDREAYLRDLIAEVVENHRRAADKEIAPWVAELIEIENRKPPRPILIDNRSSTMVELRPVNTEDSRS